MRPACVCENWSSSDGEATACQEGTKSEVPLAQLKVLSRLSHLGFFFARLPDLLEGRMLPNRAVSPAASSGGYRNS